MGDANGTSSLSLRLGNGDGSFKATVSLNASLLNPHGLVIEDFNGDGVNDIITGSGTTTWSVLLAETARVTTAPQLDLYTQKNARNSLVTLYAALDRIIS